MDNRIMSGLAETESVFSALSVVIRVSRRLGRRPSLFVKIRGLF
jgi:hypothetical protein